MRGGPFTRERPRSAANARGLADWLESTIIMVNHVRLRAGANDAPKSLNTIAADLPAVIYAFRCDDGAVKIGFSTRLAKRRATLKFSWADLLGFMPGTIEQERELHKRLVRSRQRGGEYYRPTNEVLDVIDEMRQVCGLSPLPRSARPRPH